MAIHDALAVIDRTWPDIEPRLTVRELAALADLGHTPVEDLTDLTERLFFVLARAVPVDHPAWSALRASGTRFSPGAPRPPTAELISRYIARAQGALTRPSIVEEAAADFLEEATTRLILRAGVTTEPPVTGVPLLGFDLDDRRVYPIFQFASTDPPAVHALVGQLAEQLDTEQDSLGAIGWWLTPNTWLGQPPAALLGTGRDTEIAYAAEQLLNDNW